MSMTTEQALLAAIWESPHDDLPRLVYADWLDETGDPAKAARAEFIRVQCELARMGEFDDRRESLTNTEQALLHSHRGGFLPHLPDQVARVEYDRGFALPTLQLSAKRLRSRGPNFLRHAPLWAFDLSLRGESDEFAALTKTDKLTRTARLRLRFERDGRHLGGYGVWLSAADCFRNLTHLDLGTAFDDALGDQLREFCRAPNMPRLQALSFEGGLTAETVPHLIDAPFASALRSLKIGDLERLSPEGLSRLLSAASFTGLRELELRGLRHSHPSMYLARFARETALRDLKRLSLSLDVTEPEWIAPFRYWSAAQGLEELSLRTGSVSTIRTIIGERIFPHLKRVRAHVPGHDFGHTRVVFGPTTEVITSGVTPGDPLAELLRFAAGHGVTLQLGWW